MNGQLTTRPHAQHMLPTLFPRHAKLLCITLLYKGSAPSFRRIHHSHTLVMWLCIWNNSVGWYWIFIKTFGSKILWNISKSIMNHGFLLKKKKKKNINNFRTNSSNLCREPKKNTNFHKRMGKEQVAISIIIWFFHKKMIVYSLNNFISYLYAPKQRGAYFFIFWMSTVTFIIFQCWLIIEKTLDYQYDC